MPLNQEGVISHSSNIGKDLERQIEAVLSLLDRKVNDISRTRGLFPSQVRLFQPLHCCVLVADNEIFVVLAIQDVGGSAKRIYRVRWTQ